MAVEITTPPHIVERNRKERERREHNKIAEEQRMTELRHQLVREHGLEGAWIFDQIKNQQKRFK